MDAEELLAVAGAVAIGVGGAGIGAIEVGFVTIGDAIGIGVRIGGIETETRLQLVGRVVRILIGGGGDCRRRSSPLPAPSQALAPARRVRPW